MEDEHALPYRTFVYFSFTNRLDDPHSDVYCHPSTGNYYKSDSAVHFHEYACLGCLDIGELFRRQL